MLGQGRVPNERAAFQEVLAEAEGPAAVAMEATYHWYHLYDLLEELAQEVHLAHPLKVRAIAEARIKTDKIDATVLAHLLRTNLLPKALIDTEVREAEAVRHRCTTCRRTFRHYPEGVSHYRQSQRVMASPSFSGPWGFPSGRRVTSCTS